MEVNMKQSTVAASKRRSKPIAKDGRPLAGAALKSFMKKSAKDVATVRDGRALADAANMKEGQVQASSEKAVV
jgi:hypothetical protein